MWIDELNDLVLLPRAQQYSALRQLRKNFTESHDEQWNTAFGPTSLYEAWTQLPLMQGLYQRNRAVIHETLQGRSDWHIVEIGGGNGALWQGLLDTQQAGTLTLIDPHAEAHDAVAAAAAGEYDLPANYRQRRACRDTRRRRDRVQPDIAPRRGPGLRAATELRPGGGRKGRNIAALCRGDAEAWRYWPA